MLTAWDALETPHLSLCFIPHLPSLLICRICSPRYRSALEFLHLHLHHVLYTSAAIPPVARFKVSNILQTESIRQDVAHKFIYRVIFPWQMSRTRCRYWNLGQYRQGQASHTGTVLGWQESKAAIQRQRAISHGNWTKTSIYPRLGTRPARNGQRLQSGPKRKWTRHAKIPTIHELRSTDPGNAPSSYSRCTVAASSRTNGRMSRRQGRKPAQQMGTLIYISL
jgi:hypothetical protein